MVGTDAPCGSPGHDVYKENGRERVDKYGRNGMI